MCVLWLRANECKMVMVVLHIHRYPCIVSVSDVRRCVSERWRARADVFSLRTFYLIESMTQCGLGTGRSSLDYALFMFEK